MNKKLLIRLEDQFCFSLYRLSKLITNGYKEFLDELDLTYPQYLVMIVMWEEQKINMTGLGEKLSLDNGTLTPLIKRLIDKGYVEKKRCSEDERIVYIRITDEGNNLKSKALEIPEKIACSNDVDFSEIDKLKKQIDDLYNKLTKNKKES